jgi:2-dehydropantoate 2-reductase
MKSPFRHIAVVGAGAVGSYYGALLAGAGYRVTLIGRQAHAQAVNAGGLRLRRAGHDEAIAVAATSGLDAARDADLVLLAVKSGDTEVLARQLAPRLSADALVLSLQNGVENAATLARHLQLPIVPAVVYVATAMPEPGLVLHSGGGDLVIGARDAGSAQDAAMQARLQSVVDLFASAGVTVRVSSDVMGELWTKLMVNCAWNAVSALAQAPYGRIAEVAAMRTLQHEIVREVVAVAQADGQRLALDEALAAMEAIAVRMPLQRSSTAQDLARGKPSEIDHLNGFVVRRGAELGVATPVNQALHALVKLAEAEGAAQAAAR